MGERRDRPGAQAAHALRWLGAPGTLVSLAVLAVNDHVLKQVWPGVAGRRIAGPALRRGATAATSPCYEPQGLTSVGVVRGDFTGPPAAEEERIVIPSGGSMPPSIDIEGTLRAVHRVDSVRITEVGPILSEVCSRRIWFGRRRAPGLVSARAA